MKPTSEILSQISKNWNLSEEFEFIRKVENWVYKDSVNKVFIRITEPSHRSEDQINAELDWMFYLGATGIDFAHPIKSVKGRLVECMSGNFFVSVFKEARGAELSQKDDFTENRLFNWGQLIGNLHTKTLNYNTAPGIAKRPEWDTEGIYQQVKGLCCTDEALSLKFTLVDNWLKGLSKNENEYNLIHADIHHGNFFVDKHDDIMLFDFDDCHYHWLAYDLAVPIFTLSITMRKKCSEQELQEMTSHFIRGYRQSGVLTDFWVTQLDNFILYRHFVIYTWSMENLVNPDVSDDAREWMLMAKTFCLSYINNFDYRQLQK